MALFKTLDDIGNVTGKRALVRVDLNVPMHDRKVTDVTRLRVTLPTVTELADRGAIVLLLSHLGRPDGLRRRDMSLSLVTAAYRDVLRRPVRFIDNWLGEEGKQAVGAMAPGDIAMLENTRFYSGEEKNDLEFAASMAQLGDLYVNDAFSAAHRAHASTEGLAHLLPAYAGRAMESELRALEKVLGDPKRPLVAVVGGAKVSSKIEILGNLIQKVDCLIIGGAMANTFLAACGSQVGMSVAEHGLKGAALEILNLANANNCPVQLPRDVVVAKEFVPNPPFVRTIDAQNVALDDLILDIGPAAVEDIFGILKRSRTLVWNGPLGAFETPPFERATIAMARFVADLTIKGLLTSVAGGGDTIAALDRANASGSFTFVSTAGGAFLEWMGGKDLPGVKALKSATV